MKATVKQIFNYIQGMNATTSTISSIGTFVSEQNRQVAEYCIHEVTDSLVNSDTKETLAFKIASTNSKFSDKQLWVIAFELEKNENFSAKVAEFYAEIERKSNAKAEASKAKLAANKEASSDILASVKNAGKKLGDYYAFLKSNKKFKREFFSKKYTQESVNEFINN